MRALRLLLSFTEGELDCVQAVSDRAAKRQRIGKIMTLSQQFSCLALKTSAALPEEPEIANAANRTFHLPKRVFSLSFGDFVR
jgi:hypothetical protein